MHALDTIVWPQPNHTIKLFDYYYCINMHIKCFFVFISLLIYNDASGQPDTCSNYTQTEIHIPI